MRNFKEKVKITKPINSFEKINSTLLDLIVRQFRLDINGDHGISHWRRVYKIGDYLAKETGADPAILGFFAYLHDAKKENDVYDHKHGQKACFLAMVLHTKGVIPLSKEQIDKLAFACKHHDNGTIKSEDITIQTCWDADRLDLWRVGVIPNKEFLNTDFAKKDEVIEFWRSNTF